MSNEGDQNESMSDCIDFPPDAVLRAKLGVPERQLRLLPKRLSQILCAKSDAEL